MESTGHLPPLWLHKLLPPSRAQLLAARAQALRAALREMKQAQRQWWWNFSLRVSIDAAAAKSSERALLRARLEHAAATVEGPYDDARLTSRLAARNKREACRSLFGLGEQNAEGETAAAAAADSPPVPQPRRRRHSCPLPFDVDFPLLGSTDEVAELLQQSHAEPPLLLPRTETVPAAALPAAAAERSNGELLSDALKELRLRLRSVQIRLATPAAASALAAAAAAERSNGELLSDAREELRLRLRSVQIRCASPAAAASASASAVALDEAALRAELRLLPLLASSVALLKIMGQHSLW
jgi:hypothetical protein